MIEWRLTPSDVARIRFAFSPLWELVLSLVVLRAPARHSLHLPWVRWVRPRLAHLDLSELFALVPVKGIIADFLTPPPSSPLPDVAADLELVRRTSTADVLDNLLVVPGLPRAVDERIREDPAAALERIVDTLQAYWEVALAEHWPRIAALLEADVLWRARRLAAGGAQALFADLHDSVTWQGDRVRAADPWDYAGSLSGEGLLLIPSAMGWPAVRKTVEPLQAALAYPVRGVATLWESGPPPSSHALADLVGRTRARVLAAVAEPTTTTALARLLGVTVGGVSQHLSVLRANGLVAGTRVGGVVLYHRTARGDALVSR